MLPNLPCTDSSGAVGLNLLPMVQCSSLSAAPVWPSVMEKPEPLRRADGASGSATFDSGRDDLQSLASSETFGGGGGRRSPGCPSKRRCEDSRESPKDGRGASLRQLLENLESSSEAALLNPGFSFASAGLNIPSNESLVKTHGVQQRSLE